MGTGPGESRRDGSPACPDLSFVRFNLSKNEPESEVTRLESRPAGRLNVHGGLMRALEPMNGTKADGLHGLICWLESITRGHWDSQLHLYTGPAQDFIHQTSRTRSLFHLMHQASSILWIFPLGLQQCYDVRARFAFLATHFLQTDRNWVRSSGHKLIKYGAFQKYSSLFLLFTLTYVAVL